MSPQRTARPLQTASLALIVALLACPAAEAQRKGRVTARGRTGIIATIGPASHKPAVVRGMIRAGMSMARINLAHGTARSTRAMVKTLRSVAAREKRPLPLVFDLPGGKVRTGTLASKAPVTIKKGQSFQLFLGKRLAGDQRGVHVNYRGLGEQVKVGDTVLMDDGKLQLKVVKATADRVTTTVMRGGQLRARTGVAIKGKELPFPAMTAKDRRKLKIAVDNGADYVAVSFVQSKKNLLAVRRALDKLGAGKVKVIAKVESLSGIGNIDGIIQHADAVMIARGDLGIATGKKGLPRAQATIAARCREQGKPFITATNFMSNMMKQPRPSRSNLADIWTAAGQGPSHIMLNETAVGPYPVKTVDALHKALVKRR